MPCSPSDVQPCNNFNKMKKKTSCLEVFAVQASSNLLEVEKDLIDEDFTECSSLLLHTQ
jgi:hypothetical protein